MNMTPAPHGEPAKAATKGFAVAAPPDAFAVIEQQVWSTGLFDCTNDVGNCCLTCWCPCITFGRIAEIVDQGSTPCGVSAALYGIMAYFSFCSWIYSFPYRTRLRAQYNLPESPCCDCFVHFCCASCALCQEYRELRSRGYVMELGWELNAQKGDVQPPAVQQGMMR